MVNLLRRATPAKRKRSTVRMTAKALKRWRRAQRDPTTGRPATLRQAAEWYGVTLRSWQYWEAEPPATYHDVPVPLQRRIEQGDTIFGENGR